MSLRPFPVTTPVHRAASSWSPASSSASGTGSPGTRGSTRLGSGSLTFTGALASPGVAEAQALFSPIRGAGAGAAACVGAGLGLTFSGREKASRLLPSASGPRMPVGYRPGSVSSPGGPGMTASGASGSALFGASASSRDFHDGDFSPGLAGAGSGLSMAEGDADEAEEDRDAGWIVSSPFGRSTPSTALGLLVDLAPEGRRAVGGTSVVAPYLHEVLPRLVTDLIPDVPRSGAKAKRLGTLLLQVCFAGKFRGMQGCAASAGLRGLRARL